MAFDPFKSPKAFRVLSFFGLAALLLGFSGCGGGKDWEKPASERKASPNAIGNPLSAQEFLPPAKIGYPETGKVLSSLSPFLRELHSVLARKPGPNLVKSYDVGPPTDYHTDTSWHSLRKEKAADLPRFGCLGLINPNTELQYLIGFGGDDGKIDFSVPGRTVLHGVDFLAEEIKLGDSLTAFVTFLPYDSSTLMTFIEFRNAGEAPQRIRVCQRVEKEVFSRTGEGPSQRMPGVVVATGALMDATHDNQGSSLVYEEWEQLQSGPVPIGKLLALIGGDRTPLKTNDERPSLARTTSVELGWVVHSAERVYEVRVPEAGEAGIALFLGLQRFWPREWVLYPRGAKPFLQGQWTVALKSIQSKVSAAFKFDWRDSLKSRIEAYGRYPVVDLPPDNWEPDFLACLELPRGETFSPQQEMPVPFYNFCRFYGNEIRRWWSYGMHAHESLSTFVTALTDPELAQNHLRGHFVNQDPDGAFPYGVSMISRPGMRTFQAAAATAPWITWEAWNAYLWSGDRKFLDEAMERCEKSYRWWMEDRDRTGEGLCCWLDFGETVRDDGTVPTWRYPGAPVIYQEALDLNCYLLNLEWTLAEMAAEKGDSEKSVRYREAWARRARAINGYMWHEADRCYYGTSEVSDVFVQVKDISTLMPLWAVAATADRAENLVRIFHDPKHFATSWPVPVLSVSNPQYLRDSMPHWHGGNWVEMTWLVARGLQNYGHYREAADLALRNVQMVFEEYERSGHLREYFHAETGRGLSLFDYIWAAMPASFITDVFFGIQPEREALAIVPSLPREWSRISIRNLHLRNKVLDIQVTRSKSATETLAKVNENSWPEIVEGRGIRIPWRVLEGDPKTGISIEIEQPLQIPENYGPRRNLPKDVLEPLPAHARISPTTEELAFREPILHYAPAAVPVMRPPMPWKAQH